jgi:hypothetical protein
MGPGKTGKLCRSEKDFGRLIVRCPWMGANLAFSLGLY